MTIDPKKVAEGSGMVIDFLKPMELSPYEQIAILETTVANIRSSIAAEGYRDMMNNMVKGLMGRPQISTPRKFDA
ncbi:MAG: hypothetical protein JRC53_01120 [Deltaproteobacteria bacterium]|nr:hypothetical protein [Deltaproteobacteria bacterium]